MLRDTWRRLALAASLLLVALAAPAGAAAQGEPSDVQIQGPGGPIACGVPFTLQAQVLDDQRAALPGATVTWSVVSAPSGATVTFSPTSSATDGGGIASTMATFGGPIGDRTIRATAGMITEDAVLPVTTCDGQSLPPAPPAVLKSGSCGSAIGVDPPGGYTTSTKSVRRGKYVTFKLSLPPEYGGRHIAVAYATKVGGSWSEFGHETFRTANASGDVLFHIRMSTPVWISVHGTFDAIPGLESAFTLACQAHWT